MKKRFDAVRFQRKVRQELSKKYPENPEVQEMDLERIRGKNSSQALVKLLDLQKAYFDSFVTLGIRAITLYLLISAFVLGFIIKAELSRTGRFLLVVFVVLMTIGGILSVRELRKFLIEVRTFGERVLALLGEKQDSGVFESTARVYNSLNRLSVIAISAGCVALVVWFVILVGDVTGLIEFQKGVSSGPFIPGYE